MKFDHIMNHINSQECQAVEMVLNRSNSKILKVKKDAVYLLKSFSTLFNEIIATLYYECGNLELFLTVEKFNQEG